MAGKVTPQIHFADSIVKNEELEKLLEDRQTLKDSASEFRKADKAAKEKISALNLPTPYRIGRFIIAKQSTAAKSVSFETTEGSRVSIKTVDEE